MSSGILKDEKLAKEHWPSLFLGMFVMLDGRLTSVAGVRVEEGTLFVKVEEGSDEVDLGLFVTSMELCLQSTHF